LGTKDRYDALMFVKGSCDIFLISFLGVLKKDVK